MNEIKKYEELRNKLHDAVNELCVLCGKYQFEHIGMCDGCRWKQEKHAWTKELIIVSARLSALANVMFLRVIRAFYTI